MSGGREKKKRSLKKPINSNNIENKLTTLVSLNDIEGVKYQVSQGVDVNEKIDGECAIKLAAESGNIEILKLLIEAGADLSVKFRNHEEPLVFYAKNLETLKVLVDAGADINARQKTFHLLHEAVRNKKLNIIKYLVQSCGADVNVYDCMNKTPLHLVCHFEFCYTRGFSMEVVKLLLKNHARTDALNSDRKTPFRQLLVYQKPLDDEFLKFFKFMLKYTDVTDIDITEFSIVFVNESLCKIFLEHVSALLSLGVTINSHKVFINRRPNYNEYFERCKNELTLAESTKLNKSWLTFHNLLVDDNKKLKNYAGNEDLVNDFKNMDLTRKFPIYGVQMQERMKKGMKRRELYDQSCTLFSEYLPIFNPNHLIIRDVLDCIVNTKDLSKFCKE